MRPNPTFVIAAFVLGCVIVLALILADRADDHTYTTIETTSDTTPSTTWLETQPGLGDRFDELLAGVARVKAARERARRAALFKAAYPTASYKGNPAGTWKGLPCGGDLPYCSILQCENPTGDAQAQNPRSSASGVWQFLDSTWANFGGFARAMHAPVDVQNEKARQLWRNGAGRSHWASCL